MACPICKSNHFYVKDPDDPYETYEFQVGSDGVPLQNPQNRSVPAAGEDVYCCRCSWHGFMNQIG